MCTYIKLKLWSILSDKLLHVDSVARSDIIFSHEKKPPGIEYNYGLFLY